MGLSAWQDDLPCLELGEPHREDGEGAWSGCIGSGFCAPRWTNWEVRMEQVGHRVYRARNLGHPQRVTVGRGAIQAEPGTSAQGRGMGGGLAGEGPPGAREEGGREAGLSRVPLG